MSSHRISLVDQIALLGESAPADYDPEEHNYNTKESIDAPSRGHYAEVGRSAIRHALSTTSLALDAKYEGVRVTRNDLLQGAASNSESEDGGEVAERSEGDDEGLEKQSPNSVEDDDDSVRDNVGERHATQSPSNDAMDGASSRDVTSTLRKGREEDLLKGQAVTMQLALWDTLLDTRIRLQKSVVAANRLPLPSSIDSFIQAHECRSALDRVLHETSLLLDVLDDLQENLLTTNNIVVPPPRKRRKLDSTADEKFIGATEDAAALEEALHPYLLQTLSKWSAKVQTVAPSALLSSNKGSFLKGNQQLKSAVQLIEENLNDGAKLLERTQLVRAHKARIGVAPNESDVEGPDPEIFDDTDFYQKMLRDVINLRGSGIKNEDWHLQQKRKKAAKKVDTKASKGRKLRFEVHDKIQNFMGPVPVVGAWHDEQIDELFSSLLGKGLENALHSTSEMQQSIDLNGFRVFG